MQDKLRLKMLMRKQKLTIRMFILLKYQSSSSFKHFVTFARRKYLRLNKRNKVQLSENKSSCARRAYLRTSDLIMRQSWTNAFSMTASIGRSTGWPRVQMSWLKHCRLSKRTTRCWRIYSWLWTRILGIHSSIWSTSAALSSRWSYLTKPSTSTPSTGYSSQPILVTQA